MRQSAAPVVARRRDDRVTCFLVLGFIAALYLFRVGYSSLWDNSEPTYGEIVKELFRTKDWLTLHFDFAPWFVHPPLWFWVAGASVAALGLTEFALRLPSAIFGVLCAAAAYKAAARMYGPAAGPLAALALGTSLEFIVISRLAILDTMLVFFMTVATFWAYFALTDGDRRAFWLAVLAAALGTLTKGPIAAALPAAILLIYAAWSRAWRQLFSLPLLGGLIAYVVIAGAWFAFEEHLHAGYLANYLLHANLGRAVTPFENQPGPWWYYLPVLVAGFFPYVAFVPWAVWSAIHARGSDERLLLVAAALPLAFFSIVQTKLPNYIAVMFPALSVLVGGALMRALSKGKIAAVAWCCAAVAAAATGVALYAGTSPLAQTPYTGYSSLLLGFTIVLAVLASAVAIAFVIWRKPWFVPVGLGAVMAAFVLMAELMILPVTEAFRPMKAMAATVNSYWRPRTAIGAYGVHGEYSLLFYSNDGKVTFAGDAPGDTPAQTFLTQPKRLLVVTDEQSLAGLSVFGLRALASHGHLRLLTNR